MVSQLLIVFGNIFAECWSLGLESFNKETSLTAVCTLLQPRRFCPFLKSPIFSQFNIDGIVSFLKSSGTYCYSVMKSCNKISVKNKVENNEFFSMLLTPTCSFSRKSTLNRFQLLPGIEWKFHNFACQHKIFTPQKCIFLTMGKLDLTQLNGQISWSINKNFAKDWGSFSKILQQYGGQKPHKNKSKWFRVI